MATRKKAAKTRAKGRYHLHVMMDRDLHAKLTERAQRDEVTVTQLVGWAVRHYLKNTRSVLESIGLED